jgi:hypothetical protein
VERVYNSLELRVMMCWETAFKKEPLWSMKIVTRFRAVLNVSTKCHIHWWRSWCVCLVVYNTIWIRNKSKSVVRTTLQKWYHVRDCIQKFPDWVITKYTLTTINIHWEAIQRVMEAKLTRLTHKIAIQLHPDVESCTICSSRCRRSVRKRLDTLS